MREFMKDLGKLQCTGERYSNFKTNLLEVKGEGISSVQYKIIQRPRGDDFKVEPQAAQAQDVNKLFNSDIVTQRTIYRDCMGNLPLC